MKFEEAVQNKKQIENLLNSIHREAKQSYCFMEVCGGHTLAIHKFGINTLLPKNIELLSGPGCPVCVTGIGYIDKLTAYSRLKNFTIASYGDLLRVPGSWSSLELERARGADVRIIYSVLEAVEMARAEPIRTVLFPAIGFETTAPATAVAIQQAARLNLQNFVVLSAHKTMPVALDAVLRCNSKIKGLIAPGHVSTITGSAIYSFIPAKYNVACVITGFEPIDILQSILMLVRQAESNFPKIEIQYTRAVLPEGNVKAQNLMAEVFETGNTHWRGLGLLPGSGLQIRSTYCNYDAVYRFPLEVASAEEPAGCRCPEVLRGATKPYECRHFAIDCTPANPIGACMVSSEGACQAYFMSKPYSAGMSFIS
jgi:hydrogenase expression/formation protein HypD